MILGRLKILYGPPQLLLVGLLGVQRQRGTSMAIVVSVWRSGMAYSV